MMQASFLRPSDEGIAQGSGLGLHHSRGRGLDDGTKLASFSAVRSGRPALSL